jgi:hypothetical protein
MIVSASLRLSFSRRQFTYNCNTVNNTTIYYILTINTKCFGHYWRYCNCIFINCNKILKYRFINSRRKIDNFKRKLFTALSSISCCYLNRLLLLHQWITDLVFRNLHIYLWSWAFLDVPPIVQPLKNFSAFYGTQTFNTVFTIALHWSLSWAISIQSTASHPISLKSILILFLEMYVA